MTDFIVKTELHPDLPPPNSGIGPIKWLRTNLFSTWYNSLLTLGALYLLFQIMPPLLDWAIFNADWEGKSNKDCTSGGACWALINVRFNQFMYGFYPPEHYWRVNLGFVLFVIPVAVLLIEGAPGKKIAGVFIALLYPPIAFTLFWGGLGMEEVESAQWGGLFLTLVLAIIPIAISLPLGTLLALGRRSHMPVVRNICVGFIELPRAVPLITVLFMASVVLPLFLPPGVTIDKVLRALVGMSFFAAAYMAEVIRGGLQAIPKGQYEAAQALGLSYWRMMGLVILPQALKIVIPGIVNTFIGLFKDTTLVLIIGLLDILAMINAATAHGNWMGTSTEGYVFAALIYWCFCFGMSRYSLSLETKLYTGHKR
ncbi:amino acid ABC transporter permease [Alphaproteobacteria bacterium]|nr:amino acid ABC transporter permease [Alphaproteobacteria bacterium]